MLGLIRNKDQKKKGNSLQHKPVVQRQGQLSRRRASRGQRAREDKNILTNEESSGLVLVVKLERTDTTLDLSQKARVVRFSLTPPTGL
jgi:hypothetical protein